MIAMTLAENLNSPVVLESTSLASTYSVRLLRSINRALKTSCAMMHAFS